MVKYRGSGFSFHPYPKPVSICDSAAAEIYDLRSHCAQHGLKLWNAKGDDEKKKIPMRICRAGKGSSLTYGAAVKGPFFFAAPRLFRYENDPMKSSPESQEPSSAGTAAQANKPVIQGQRGSTFQNLPERSAAGPTIISSDRCLALILLLPPFLPNIRHIPCRYPAVAVRRRYLNLKRRFVEEIPELKRISLDQPISF